MYTYTYIYIYIYIYTYIHTHIYIYIVGMHVAALSSPGPPGSPGPPICVARTFVERLLIFFIAKNPLYRVIHIPEHVFVL